MNILPFIFSILCILVLISSSLFSSFRTVKRVSTIILSHNDAYIELLSQRAKKNYSDKIKQQSHQKPKEKNLITKSEVSLNQENVNPAIFQDPRQNHMFISSSKLNIWSLWDKKHSFIGDFLYKTAVQLIECLYENADFYQEIKDKDLAKKIIDALLKQERKTSFHALFPDPPLDTVYYKMLKGTNTGYPSLEDYFKIEKHDNPAPMRFSYVSAKVLEAALGQVLAEKIQCVEKEKWEKNHKERILSQEELKVLMTTYLPDFDVSYLKEIFSFDRSSKGLPQSYTHQMNGIRAKK